MAAMTVWSAAFQFVQTVAEQWRRTAVAQNDKMPGIRTDMNVYTQPAAKDAE